MPYVSFRILGLNLSAKPCERAAITLTNTGSRNVRVLSAGRIVLCAVAFVTNNEAEVSADCRPSVNSATPGCSSGDDERGVDAHR